MRKGKIVAALIVALAVCAQSFAQPKWRVYSAPNKSFTVELPWEPVYDRPNVDGRVFGASRKLLFKGSNSLEHYNLRMYSDEPSTIFYVRVYGVPVRRSDGEFDEEVESVMSFVGGKDKHFLRDEAVTVNGLHGREYIYEKGKASGRALVINGGSRIFFVLYHTESEKGVSRGPVERVFSTFQPIG